MPVVGIDHVVAPTADAERFLAFYKRLGFETNGEEAWREGRANTFSIQVGESKINVHPQGFIAERRGVTATPGCLDICFVFEGAVDECRRMLEAANVPILHGPAPRAGGRARGKAPAVSLYARDPDGNLLEWMVYLDEPGA
jgi:catechol 2,3-dioxygenase-like lactoylglutathione lyase family enzyme